MNLFALSLLAAVATVVGRPLRGAFDRDVVAPRRGLRTDCVDGAAYVGCYADRNNHRAMPYEVRGAGHSARECMEECRDKGYAHFARQWKGQCFCGDGSEHTKHGEERNCDCCKDNVGGNKMCVWRIGDDPAPGCKDGAPAADYLGCYHDRTQNRALKNQVGRNGQRADKCHEECEDRGYKYFGREWKGQCFCGDSKDYHKHRAASGCDCCGGNVGSRKICVWKV